MIDASVDPDFAAFERQESLKEARPAGGVADGAVGRVYHGRLSALSARETPEGSESAEVVPPPEPVPPDPLGHLRTARLGFALAAVLVCYWIWMRRRRA